MRVTDPLTFMMREDEGEGGMKAGSTENERFQLCKTFAILNARACADIMCLV